MSQETQQEAITKKRVVYQIPGAIAVTVRRDIEYRKSDAGILTMDICYPSDSKREAGIPAVVFVLGYSDVGFQKMLGCKQKEMGSYVSWAELASASGLAAITYTTREPATDIHSVLQFVRQNAASLGIDGNKIGVWACSGNVPNALSVLIREGQDHLKCGVLCYGYMMDLEGSTSVADMAKKIGFVNSSAGKSVDDLPQSLPLFIARAGSDQNPHLNEMLDLFLIKALARNLPITFANHPSGPHAFDLLHDDETTRLIIEQILAFMRFHLLG